MSMGVLDAPAPLFSMADRVLDSFLPPIGRLIVWAGLAALVSMEVYRVLSPQAEIAKLRSDLRQAQRCLSQFDGEFGEAWPLIARSLSLAVRRIVVVLPATIAGSLPMLMLIVWLDNTYSHTFPPAGEPARVEVKQPYSGEWQPPAPGRRPHAVVRSQDGRVVVDKPVRAAVPELHKRQWWNALVGNPAGYLKEDAPVDRLSIDLPTRQILLAGPQWLRGWQATFFVAVLLFGIAMKWVRQIE
jgi:hypothetical protein